MRAYLRVPRAARSRNSHGKFAASVLGTIMSPPCAAARACGISRAMHASARF